jgi:hypothetical protein
MADKAERNYVFFLRRALKRFITDYTTLAPNDPDIDNAQLQELCGDAVRLCSALHVNAGSTISINDKIDLSAGSGYESFSRSHPNSPPSLFAEAIEPSVKLEVVEPEVYFLT